MLKIGDVTCLSTENEDVLAISGSLYQPFSRACVYLFSVVSFTVENVEEIKRNEPRCKINASVTESGTDEIERDRRESLMGKGESEMRN